MGINKMSGKNEHASWSIALKTIVEHYNSDKEEKTFSELFNTVIGKKKDGNDLTFDEWCKMGETEVKEGDEPINYFRKRRILNGDFKENFKIVDLGGGDQGQIRTEYALKPEEDKPTIDKYKNKIGLLTTGGNDTDREENLQFFQKALFNQEVIRTVQNPLNALSIDMETKLTAASYYDKAQELLGSAETEKICLIPIGSKDLHVIIYNKDKSVKLINRSNHSSNQNMIDLQEINNKTLFV